VRSCLTIVPYFSQTANFVTLEKDVGHQILAHIYAMHAFIYFVLKTWNAHFLYAESDTYEYQASLFDARRSIIFFLTYRSVGLFSKQYQYHRSVFFVGLDMEAKTAYCF
jgi:hypothetical protein